MTKTLALLVLVTGAVLLPSEVAGQDRPEDPFDRRLAQMYAAMNKGMEQLSSARQKWKETGSRADLQEYQSKAVEFQEVRRREGLSQLDYWEARNRLMEYIRDSDDDVVFAIYMMARRRKEKDRKLRERMDATAARFARLDEQIKARRGVSVRPPPKTPN